MRFFAAVDADAPERTKYLSRDYARVAMEAHVSALPATDESGRGAAGGTRLVGLRQLLDDNKTLFVFVLSTAFAVLVGGLVNGLLKRLLPELNP